MGTKSLNVVFQLPFIRDGKMAEEKDVRAMHAQMSKIQEMIGENDFVTGDSMTIADIFLFCSFVQCYMVPNFVVSVYILLKQFYQQCFEQKLARDGDSRSVLNLGHLAPGRLGLKIPPGRADLGRKLQNSPKLVKARGVNDSPAKTY